MAWLSALRRRLRSVPALSLAWHRAREFGFVLGGFHATPWGFRMAGPRMLRRGAFEEEEIALVRSLLPHVDAFVDVGANVGLYTMLARAAGRPTLAVEPHPANLRLLYANLVANGWDDTEVIPVALADKPGIATLFGTGTGASLIVGWSGWDRGTLLREHASASTLDLVLGNRFPGGRLLIKVDVEGAEFHLLKGAERTLARMPAPVWLVEICLTENFPGGQNPAYVATFDMFFARGYSARTASRYAQSVRPEDVQKWAREGRVAYGSYNYVFTK